MGPWEGLITGWLGALPAGAEEGVGGQHREDGGRDGWEGVHPSPPHIMGPLAICLDCNFDPLGGGPLFGPYFLC